MFKGLIFDVYPILIKIRNYKYKKIIYYNVFVTKNFILILIFPEEGLGLHLL